MIKSRFYNRTLSLLFAIVTLLTSTAAQQEHKENYVLLRKSYAR
jgi:hypothetical protein